MKAPPDRSGFDAEPGPRGSAHFRQHADRRVRFRSSAMSPGSIRRLAARAITGCSSARRSGSRMRSRCWPLHLVALPGRHRRVRGSRRLRIGSGQLPGCVQSRGRLGTKRRRCAAPIRAHRVVRGAECQQPSNHRRRALALADRRAPNRAVRAGVHGDDRLESHERVSGRRGAAGSRGRSRTAGGSANVDRIGSTRPHLRIQRP